MGKVSRAVRFAGPASGAYLGYSVNGAGDLNGDGFDDVLMAAPFEKSEGSVYVVFGRSAAEWASSSFDFCAEETPDPASWIRISGLSLGTNGISHGDFNGDGLSDILFGSQSEGMSFCFFGHRGAWSSFNVTSNNISSAVPGFVLAGGLLGMPSSYVGNAGDMNGDGIEDIIVSAYGYGPSTVFVVFGASGATRSTFNLPSVDGSNGFALFDGSTTLGIGFSIGSVGDVDGDGLADMAVGSYFASNRAGNAYILFARNVSASGQQWDAQYNLTSFIDGANGFVVEGVSSSSELGLNVVGAGDLNGDGFADIFISSQQAASDSWVVFGHASPWTPKLFPSLLDGTNGFNFAGSSENWGWSGGSAGDVNGDGIDDFIIGGYNAIDSLETETGVAAILFGRAGPWPEFVYHNDAVGSFGFLVDEA